MSSSTSTTSATASASSSSTSTSFEAPASLKVVGIILAIASGLLIGTSFVFKKKGLLRSQAGHAAGEGVAYLKSPLWWFGMTLMILGELCNFAAYAFVEALVVTPLGALSVVVCAILSSIFLKEKLSLFGWLGCALCIIGSVIIALNGPQEQTVSQITQFESMFLAPGFLVYASLMIAMALSVIFYFGPRYGKKSMLWYISVCSSIGGISVSVTTGLGSAIVATAMGDNQFDHWFIYFLIAFVAVTLLTEVYYLNVALALYNTAMVTPTYYVIFTFCSMVTTVILFQGLKSTVDQIITIVMAFFTICIGITILQLSKIDPTSLSKLDRRTTILLQAAQQPTEAMEEEKLTGIEDPGIDALRGSFGTFGSIIRAKSARRMSQSSRVASSYRSRLSHGGSHIDGMPWTSDHPADIGSTFQGLQRHQLYDAPVPKDASTERSPPLQTSSPLAYSPRRTAIKFDSQDLVHTYGPPGSGDDEVIHSPRNASSADNDSKTRYPYPPTRTQTNTGSPYSIPGTPTRQTVSVPVRTNDEPLPPTLHTHFYKPTTTDPFSTPSSPPISNFQPVPEPVNSHWSDNDDAPSSPKRTSSRPARRRSRSYPRNVDDREESVSLWEPPSEGDDEEGDAVQRSLGGIRLVKPSSKTRF